jgi:hypothetical protein
MKFNTEYIFCTKKLIDPLEEVQEIYAAVGSVPWSSGKAIAVSKTGKEIAWQEAYNRHFELAFEKIGGWQPSPVLCEKPKHKGDFLKNGVFVEVQFGNSATVYRDYYKFHYGFANRLLTLAVLVVPGDPTSFFTTRNPKSVGNMASFGYASEHLSSFSIPLPVLFIDLIPAK